VSPQGTGALRKGRLTKEQKKTNKKDALILLKTETRQAELTWLSLLLIFSIPFSLADLFNIVFLW